MKTPILYIVVPCYNEEEALAVTLPKFKDKIKELQLAGKIAAESSLFFVDDGSKDRTWEIIQREAVQDSCVRGISLTRNKGHQNALLAGLLEASKQCDITISIDCDGQDDIHSMNEMVDAYLEGAEIVYGIRKDRKKDSFFKRNTAQGYYKFLNLMGVEVIYNHADYRLVSCKVLREFRNFREVNIYLRGMIPLVGFKSTSVYYERKERVAGKGHYPLPKMLSLALEGITSLSVKPIHLITFLGFFIAGISFVGVVWSVVVALLGKAVTGWASLTCILCFVSGIQMMSLGVIGEYVGKIYLETKARPRYIVGETTYGETTYNETTSGETSWGKGVYGGESLSDESEKI